MLNPKVTVLMSVYNCEQYIEKSIKSILDQTFKSFEFIIYDDGSTDDTVNIIERLASNDKRIIVNKNLVNIGIKGFIKNLNLGIKNSRGSVIARMDADDIAHPDRLQVQYDFLNSNKDISLVATSFNYIDENGANMGSKVFNLNDKQVKEFFPEKNPIHHPTVMFRNEPDVFYREKALYCEDRDLWLRMATSNKKFHILPNILLDYRVIASSISHKNKTIQEAYIKQVNDWYLERLKNDKDSYDTFNEIENKSLTSQIEGDGLIGSIKIKYLFRSNCEAVIVRKEINAYLRKYGLFYWFPIYLYYLSTFNNPVSLRLKKYIVSKILA